MRGNRKWQGIIATGGTVALTLLLFTGSAYAQVTDAQGDFIGTYTGPQNPDLDVLSANLLLGTDGTFRFQATLAGAPGTTSTGFYVWGVNRGQGTGNFASIGLPNVMFDAIIILRPDGTGSVNRQTNINNVPGGSGTVNLAPGSITIIGNTISGVVPGSLLPTQGFAPSAYTWNLWPRSDTVGGTAAISDFAPNSTNALVSTAPEAGSGAFALIGGMIPLVGAMVARRRAKG